MGQLPVFGLEMRVSCPVTKIPVGDVVFVSGALDGALVRMMGIEMGAFTLCV